MTELFLDNQRAYPKEGTSIKLTAENVFFTKSASYTLDIELPLEIEANRAIFGWVDRIDVAKEPRQMEARLVVDNVPTLIGIATITQCNERSVRVQLLGEASAYNFRNRLDELYIDELDLGDWMSLTWPSASGRRYGPTWDMVYYAYGDGADIPNSSHSDFFANVFGDKYPWVAYPIYNSNADAYLNNYRVSVAGASSCYLFAKWTEADNRRNCVDFAVQPYVWFMAKLIANATGYELPDSDNALKADDMLSRIFIASASNYMAVNRCLPHWSVNEWWQNLEDAFGVVVCIDYASKRIRLLRRGDFYNSHAPMISLGNIVNEFSAEVDSESLADISADNVGFDGDNFDAADRLSQDIVDAAIFDDTHRTLADLYAHIRSLSDDDKKVAKGTIFQTDDGRQYICADDIGNGDSGLMEVNMFRNRIVKADSDSLDITLKFVPAKYEDMPLDFYNNQVFNYETVETYKPGTNESGYQYHVRVLSVPDRSFYSSDREYLDIENTIRGEAEVPEKESGNSCIYIGIAVNNRREALAAKTDNPANAMGYATIVVQYPIASLRDRSYMPADDAANDASPYSLSLVTIDGVVNLAAKTVSENHVAINTAVKHCIKFVADRIPDPGSVFLIRNKRFVCEKIEANISADGLDKLMTGYFYSLT